MGLTRYKLGELIEPVDERNTLGLTNFSGLNISKEFMPTAASTVNLDASKYKVVRKKRFVFSGMQTGRDKTIRISMYEGEEPIIVSPAYTTFEISRNDVVIPEYFFMLFKSPEMDRYGWFLSDSSIRSNLDWPVFCGIKLNLPPLEIQQKYVNIYNAMLANQQSYEQGLDDLRVTYEGFVEDLKQHVPLTSIGKYLHLSEVRNIENLSVKSVRGIATSKQLIPTKADMKGVKLDNYKLLVTGAIAYVPDTSRRGDKISLAQNTAEVPYIVSSISTVFDTDREYLVPDYLMLFLSRSEFDRYSRFNSWGSARETFDWSEMCDVKIPIPEIEVQQSVSSIYKVYLQRRSDAEKLKAELKDICPVLIKGSLDEAAREEAQL
ncbi:restriction endonuclease subunit S [Mobiluncus mulieris]|uniref:restriction endonuclease subunit S n=1 Tax=Mobiluncus mulieris TaxID=2052 RepID=UPI0021E2E30F|nr:hypothetical protein [Mobiluncus mulieris]MCU9997446.1 restriction endonuclease subunit S [Mobiluncus mulieris]